MCYSQNPTTNSAYYDPAKYGIIDKEVYNKLVNDQRIYFKLLKEHEILKHKYVAIQLQLDSANGKILKLIATANLCQEEDLKRQIFNLNRRNDNQIELNESLQRQLSYSIKSALNYRGKWFKALKLDKQERFHRSIIWGLMGSAVILIIWQDITGNY